MFFQIASVFADHFGTACIDVADPLFGETGIEAAIQTFLAKLCMVICSLQGPTSNSFLEDFNFGLRLLAQM